MPFLQLFLMIIWGFLEATTVAQGLDPIENFCKRWWHQSIEKNGFFYIHGGLATFQNRVSYNELPYTALPTYIGPTTAGPNIYLLTADVSESWDWRTNISLRESQITASSSKNGFPPQAVQNAALFSGSLTDPQFYLYGGSTTNINSSFPDLLPQPAQGHYLFGCNPQTNEWTPYNAETTTPSAPSWGASAESTNLQLGFYFNGITGEMNTSTASGVETLMVINLQTHTITSLSTALLTKGNPIAGGGLVYIPNYGNDGILVSLGGLYAQEQTSGPALDLISIFDLALIETDKNTTWYQQSTSRTAPTPRADFCVVVASAPDNSSHNIYMYGGWNPTTATYYDEVWILSIPSFTWIQIWSGTSPRAKHTCSLVGNRQMITSGGLDSWNYTDVCDWEYESLGMYDLTINNWSSVFNIDDPPYEVNSNISAAIGGDAAGNADMLLPSGGWSSPELAALFTTTANQSAPASKNLTSPSPNSPQIQSPAPSHGNSRKKIIIGATTGSVVGAVTLTIVSFFVTKWWRARASKRSEAPLLPNGSLGTQTMPERGSLSFRMDHVETSYAGGSAYHGGRVHNGPEGGSHSNHNVLNNTFCGEISKKTLLSIFGCYILLIAVVVVLHYVA